jgi:hypothetical protein
VAEGVKTYEANVLANGRRRHGFLSTITELSHVFGASEYVKAGGATRRAKRRTPVDQPSGTTLAGLTPGAFVAMDRALLGRCTRRTPTIRRARGAGVKDMMAAAVKPETPGRASVEAPLHDSLSARFVVHTHPACVNGLTCALGGEAAAAELFPDALWMPYVDPGYTLCMAVRKAVAAYRTAHGRRAGPALSGEPRRVRVGRQRGGDPCDLCARDGRAAAGATPSWRVTRK